MTGPGSDHTPNPTGSRVLAGLLALTIIASVARVAMALVDGAITDKHGHVWSRATDPGHFWLLLTPCLVTVVIPAGVVIALWRRAIDRSR